MEDLLQQLEHLLNLVQEKHALNFARQEAINAWLDSLTQELAASKGKASSWNHGNHNHEEKDKSVVSSSGSVKGSIVPKVTKLDFPHFKGKEDSLGWLNRCENFLRQADRLARR